jgi:hypothetical protein
MVMRHPSAYGMGTIARLPPDDVVRSKARGGVKGGVEPSNRAGRGRSMAGVDDPSR